MPPIRRALPRPLPLPGLTAAESAVLREAAGNGGGYAVEAIWGVGPEGGRFVEHARRYAAAVSVAAKGFAEVRKKEQFTSGLDLHCFISISLTDVGWETVRRNPL